MGYIVLSIIILVMLVGIYFIIWSIRGDKTGSVDEAAATSGVIITPTPSLAPVAATATPTIAITEAPAAAPTEPPAAPTDTPAPAVADTPAPESKTPSPSQVKTAVDGKTNNTVRLRKGPGTSYDSVDTFASGTQLKIYALEDEFYFVMVVKSNLYGYMAAKYVEKKGLLPGESATPTPPVPEGLVAGTVSASEVALRSMPTTEGNTPFASLVQGDAVYIHYRTDDFYYVEVLETGKKGYAYWKYIRAEGDVPRATPAP